MAYVVNFVTSHKFNGGGVEDIFDIDFDINDYIFATGLILHFHKNLQNRELDDYLR